MELPYTLPQDYTLFTLLGHRSPELWLDSPPHRANLMARRWRDLGIAYERGHMFGRDGVALWVMQFGQRR